MVVTASENYLAKIKVVGVGGGGVNAVNRMIEAGLRGVEFIAVNTDAQALLMSDADVKLDIGKDLTKGLGAGANPEKGRQAAEDDADNIKAALEDTDMVFVTAGEGGGTGSGAAPVISKIARSEGILTIAVVTRPFTFEGRVRAKNAETGIAALRESVDALIIIPNDKLLEGQDPDITSVEAFKQADQVLMQGVSGISDLITIPGQINLDFADVQSVMKNAGSAIMGIGSASGENRAEKAAEMAISSPLLETGIDGAKGVLWSIAAGSDLGLFEMSKAAERIQEAAHPDANIIFGHIVDDSMGDEVRITVVAAGFDEVDQACPKAKETAASTANRTRGANQAPVNISASAPVSAVSASRPPMPTKTEKEVRTPVATGAMKGRTVTASGSAMTKTESGASMKPRVTAGVGSRPVGVSTAGTGTTGAATNSANRHQDVSLEDYEWLNE